MKRTNTVHPNRCFAGSVALKARQYENLPRPDSPLAQPARDVTSPPPAARLARSLTDKPLPVSAAIPVQATLEDKATAPEIDALVPEPDSPSSIYTLPANHVEDDATSLLDGLSKKPTSAVLPPHISRSQSYPRTKPLPLPMKTKQPCPPHVAQIAVSAQDPWLQYQALSLDESWAGSEATIACLRHSHSSSNTLYAVRTVKGYDSEKLAKWKKITAPNIVELMQIFTLESSERTMYFAYEYIDVSLADIQAGVTLDEVHISTVCRDVLNGLSYVHDYADMVHGHLNRDTVLVTFSGVVKIGNIVEVQMPNWMETGKADDFTALMTMTQDMVSDQDHSPTFDELLTDFYRDLVSSRSSQVYAGKLSEHEFCRMGKDGCMAPLALYAHRNKFRRWKPLCSSES